MVLGAGLLALTMFGLLFGLIEGSSNGWTVLPFASIGVGLLGFIAFCYRQKTAKNPLIKPSLLANRGFTSGLVMGLVLFAAIGGVFYVISLFLQLGLGLTPSHAALSLVPVALGIVVASVIAMALIARLGRLLIFFGLLISLAGIGWLLALVARPRDGRRSVGHGPGALRHGLRHGHLLRHPLRRRTG